MRSEAGWGDVLEGGAPTLVGRMERLTGIVEKGVRAAANRPTPEVSAFLTRLAIALNRSNAYPADHPVLATGFEELARDIESLTLREAHVTIGVARSRLIVSGTETDAGNPLHRGLAARLHRQQVGAIRFQRGTKAAELSALLSGLAASRLSADQSSTSEQHANIQVTAFSAGDLAFAASGSDAAPDDIWRGIAEVVMDDAHVAQGMGVLQAVHDRATTESGREVVAQELSRLAAQAAGPTDDAPEAGEALGQLLSGLDADVVGNLLASMTEGGQKARFMADAVEGVPIDTVVPLLSAAAGASDETLSHALLRLLTKLAAQAEGRHEGAVEADAMLRESVQSLVQNWTLDDPNPREYRNLLVRLTRNESEGGATRSLDDACERLFLMGLETGTDSATFWSALGRLLEQNNYEVVLTALSRIEPASLLGEKVRRQVMASPQFTTFLASERANAEVIALVADWAGPVAAAEPLLHALEASDNAATRRRLLSTLETLGGAIAPLLIVRLTGRPWYVRRNMLVLLGALDEQPVGFSASPYLTDADPRVRREAVKIAVREPADRDAALAAGLTDTSELVIVAALAGLRDRIPEPLVPVVMAIAEREDLARETRAMAVRAAARHGGDQICEWLVRQAVRRRWFLPLKLAARTEALPVIVSVLRDGWPEMPEVRRILALAARSSEAEIRTAAGRADP